MSNVSGRDGGKDSGIGSSGAADSPADARWDSGDDSLWDAKDVARYCKASRSWVYFQAEAGLLPSVRIGGLRRFIPAQVKAFVRGESVPASNIVALPGYRR